MAPVDAGYTDVRRKRSVRVPGATGLTFYDDAVSTFCGTRSAVMTEVAVGKSAYRAKRGGLGKDAPTIAGRALDLYLERTQELKGMGLRPRPPR